MSCDWPNHMAKLAKQSANIVHEMQSLWFFPCLSLPNFNLQPNTQGEQNFHSLSLSREKNTLDLVTLIKTPGKIMITYKKYAKNRNN